MQLNLSMTLCCAHVNLFAFERTRPKRRERIFAVSSDNEQVCGRRSQYLSVCAVEREPECGGGARTAPNDEMCHFFVAVHAHCRVFEFPAKS